ncbi:AAA family ATPase [Halostella sp. PRR32]|uniref:AAA family ATPase n=1 Tax=Halostella sp. PRR32 TaxID=3098147 RepID=UPI002B1DCBC5|nr:AAA family ATPase [Halostella sp. PRR32]
MIREIRVQNYKSIRKSGWVNVDEMVTTLVGGNEAGKTNFLESITLLGNTRTVDDNELCDYNSNELLSKDKENIVILESKIPVSHLYSVLELSGRTRPAYHKAKRQDAFSHKRDVELKDREVIARRYADGTHRLEFREEGQDARKYLQYAISERIEEIEYKVTVRQLIKDLDERLGKLTGSEKLLHDDARIEDFLAILEGIKSYLIENREILTESGGESEGGKSVSQLIKEVVGMIDSYRERDDIILYVRDLELFPRIYSFDNITEIDDEAKIKELEEDPSASNAYFSLLQFAGLEPSQLPELDSGQIRDRRKQAGKRLTQIFNRYWDQSNIDIRMELSGGRVSLHLYDESDVRKQPSDRSTGLRWFLSFLARVITQSEEGFANSIILLDDPGVHLHPSGHKDLRRALNRLAEDNQVIYSTHAPYMIDTGNLRQIRVVERAEQRIGTKVKRVGQQNTASDDSLAPVRASLGATFADSLFSSKYTILVEGFEDRVYLNRFSEFFRRDNEGPFFDAEMKIIDCGGASKTDYMSRLVSAENYEYAVLLDSDDAGQRAKDTLTKQDVSEEKITQITDIMDGEGEFTIEDLFLEEFYCEVAAEVHNIEKESLLQALSESSKPLSHRVDGAIKEVLELGDTNGIVLDKKEVSKKIDAGISEGEYGVNELGEITLQNFESVIRALIESLDIESDEANEITIQNS